MSVGGISVPSDGVNPFFCAGCSAEEFQSLAAEFVHGFHQFLLCHESGCHEGRGPDGISGVLGCIPDEILGRDIVADVDHLVAGAPEHCTADVLPDIMDITGDRPHHDDGAVMVGSFGIHLLAENLHGLIHNL